MRSPVTPEVPAEIRQEAEGASAGAGRRAGAMPAADKARSGAPPLWRMPIVLAALTVFGLLVALVDAAPARWLAWAALAVPLAAIGWCWLRAPRGQAGKRLLIFLPEQERQRACPDSTFRKP